MGFFQNLFGKQNCTLCTAECGPMHRTKIQNKEFVCSDCVRNCSKYVQLYKMDKATIEEHIEYMKKQNKLFTDVFAIAKSTKHGDYGNITFADELGMFTINEMRDPANKNYKEVFRYDQVESYEPYQEMDTNVDAGKDPKVKEVGIKIKLVSPQPDTLSMPMANDNRKGLRVHPYIEDEIKVVLASSEREMEFVESSVRGIVMTFDRIFGREPRALFSFGPSKEEKRQVAAGVAAVKGMGAMLKAVKEGQDLKTVAEQQVGELADRLNDLDTGGLAEYTRRADEAERKAWS